MAAKRRRSRKRSAASSRSPKPPELVFFVDRSLGRRVVAQALRAAGATVLVHDDKFAPDARDVDWLARAGREGWIVLTKDERITRHPLERDTLLESGVRAFVLTAANLTGAKMAQVFLQALPRINRLAATVPRPFVARLSRGGTVRVLNARPRSSKQLLDDA